MIPPVAHFIWLGTHLPFTHVLSLRSAAQRGGFERIVFHHDSDLSTESYFEAIYKLEKLELRRIKPETILAPIGSLGTELIKLYQRIRQPAAKANVLRAAILFQEGGVYLDTDTITVREITEFRRCGAFFGVEPICFPATIAKSKNILTWARAYALTGIRDILRRISKGAIWFQTIEKFYTRAANNAILGAAPEHPLIRALLEGMIRMPLERQTVRYALGTHLLQEVSTRFYYDQSISICEPTCFYPLGPEISEHWFRVPAGAQLEKVLSPKTSIVHWYASVRTKHIIPQIDAQYILKNAHHQLFSQLAFPFI